MARMMAPSRRPALFARAGIALAVVCAVLLAWTLLRRPAPAEMRRQLQQQEQRWNTRQVGSYRVTVRVLHTFAAYRTTVTVREGQVVARECGDSYMFGQQRCEAEPPLTSPALFAIGRELTDRAERSIAEGHGVDPGQPDARPLSPARLYRFGFNRRYGFPESMAYDNPIETDDDWSYTVEQFTPE